MVTNNVTMMKQQNSSSAVPAFLSKLWTLVEDEDTNGLICWSQEGNSFLVLDEQRFAKDILPKFFKHSNMASFIRQLNMYGFRKVMSCDSGHMVKQERDGPVEFQHPFFKHGQDDLLEHIKRKVSSTRPGEDRRQEDLTRLLTSVQNVHGRQEAVDTRLTAMKRENEALWREISDLRQKHAHQQQLIKKLIHFIVTLVQNNHIVNLKRKRPILMNSNGKKPKYIHQIYEDQITDDVIICDVTQGEEPGGVTDDITESTLRVLEEGEVEVVEVGLEEVEAEDMDAPSQPPEDLERRALECSSSLQQINKPSSLEQINKTSSSSALQQISKPSSSSSALQQISKPSSSSSALQQISKPSSSSSALQQISKPSSSSSALQQISKPSSSSSALQQISKPSSSSSALQQISKPSSSSSALQQISKPSSSSSALQQISKPSSSSSALQQISKPSSSSSALQQISKPSSSSSALQQISKPSSSSSALQQISKPSSSSSALQQISKPSSSSSALQQISKPSSSSSALQQISKPSSSSSALQQISKPSGGLIAEDPFNMMESIMNESAAISQNISLLGKVELMDYLDSIDCSLEDFQAMLFCKPFTDEDFVVSKDSSEQLTRDRLDTEHNTDKQLIQYTHCPLLAFLDGSSMLEPQTSCSTVPSSDDMLLLHSSCQAPPSQLLEEERSAAPRSSALVRLEPLTEAEASQDTLFHLVELEEQEHPLEDTE